nr:riboflavin synthase [Peptostreptococcus faecalis]
MEEVGEIKTIKRGSKSAILSISANMILEDVHIGDSIAVNGICLTVTSFSNNEFSVDVMHETISRSSFNGLSQGSKVNLERAMHVNARFGGHIVSGHIDGIGKIVSIKKDDNAIWYEISTTDNILKYIIEKGSIAIDGISLTVAKLTDNSFSVSIIPHTVGNTILGFKKIGDVVNLENDCIGKYVEKLLSNTTKKSGISKSFLLENGF